MTMKEKLLGAGIIGAGTIGSAAIGTAIPFTGIPLLVGSGIAVGAGAIAAREAISEMRQAKNKCFQSFIDYYDFKTVVSQYEHECKRHRYNPQKRSEVIEGAKKIFLVFGEGSKFDPCGDVMDYRKELAERKAEWMEQCKKVV
jgi:hypothetical protein